VADLSDPLCEEPRLLAQIDLHMPNRDGLTILAAVTRVCTNGALNLPWWHLIRELKSMPARFELGQAWQMMTRPTIKRELSPFMINDLLNLTVEYIVGEKVRRTNSTNSSVAAEDTAVAVGGVAPVAIEIDQPQSLSVM
jgi:hypothetical protein